MSSLLNLGEAVGEIHQAVDQNRRRSLRSPFFFLVGAGISHPPIPLASEIQGHCETEAQRYVKSNPPKPVSALDSYSYWFERAYPQPDNRQHYLRELIEGKFISRANFRLAHLLLDGRVSNLVVTTNFDDFLSRALNLFGRTPIVCDHPKTLERIDLESDQLQIIHIHGSYRFYDCCNLTQEIAERAAARKETSVSMLSLLDNLLWTHSPLVVGYSGWEGDVFMHALQRRLYTPLRTRVYWFCYSKEQLSNLPIWLQENANVRFVVPAEAEASVGAELRLGQTTEAKSADEPPAGTYVAGSARTTESYLRATAIFDELIRKLELEPPPLTKDPLGFFSNHLKRSLIGDKSDDIEDDVYAIRAVIERLERLKQEEARLFLSPIQTVLESFRNAVRQSKHREAILLAAQIPVAGTSEDALREISSALAEVVPALKGNPDEELKGYDLIVAIESKFQERGQNDSSAHLRLARAIFNKGRVLTSLERVEDAIAAYDEVVRRFGEGADPSVQERVAASLRNKGFALGQLNRHQEAIAAYDELVRRFGEAAEPSIREHVAVALRNKGYNLIGLKRDDEAIAAYEELVRRFTDVSEPGIREHVAVAIRNTGVIRGELKRNEEAIVAYDEVARRFGDAPEPAIRYEVAAALRGKGVALGQLNRSEEAIAAYDELVRRFGDAAEPALRYEVTAALRSKGVTLSQLNRGEEAIAAYDELVRRFGDATEAGVQSEVAAALRNKGFALGQSNRREEAMAAYDEVVRRFGDATEPRIREHVAVALRNKGVTLGQLNRKEGELAVYDELVRRFGNAPEPSIQDEVKKAEVRKRALQSAT